MARVVIFNTAEDAAAHTAQYLLAALHQHPDMVLGLATGNTMIPVYEKLAQRAGTALGQAHTFNLDEYIGLETDAPESFHHYMRVHLFDHLSQLPAKVDIPNGCAADTDAEAQRYRAAIDAAGGIDLQLLGIGVNGHLGFNEPGSAFDSTVRVVNLTDETKTQNAPAFTAGVPTQAITVGLREIRQARRCILLATGSSKAKVIARALRGAIAPDCPATVLQAHDDVLMVLDTQAARELI